MSGYSRAEVMQKSSTCDFLYGPLTTPGMIRSVREAVEGYDERRVEILYYKKDGKRRPSSEFTLKARIDPTTQNP